MRQKKNKKQKKQKQVALILLLPPLHTQPLGCGLLPIIHTHPDKTTEHRPYHSACGHQPVSPSPFDHYHKYIHTPKWHFSH